MARNEVIYRLTPAPALERLVPSLGAVLGHKNVRWDADGNAPPGISYVSYKSLKAHIGVNGGVQIFYTNKADHDHFIEVVKSLVPESVWKITKPDHAISIKHLEQELADFEKQWQMLPHGGMKHHADVYYRIIRADKPERKAKID